MRVHKKFKVSFSGGDYEVMYRELYGHYFCEVSADGLGKLWITEMGEPTDVERNRGELMERGADGVTAKVIAEHIMCAFEE